MPRFLLHIGSVFLLLGVISCSQNSLQDALTGTVTPPVASDPTFKQSPYLIEIISPSVDDTVMMNQSFVLEAAVVENPLDNVQVQYVQFELISLSQSKVLGFKSTPNFAIPVTVAESGNRTLRATAKLSDGSSIFHEITLPIQAPQVVNQKPTAVNDAFTILQGSTLNITANSLLMNDTDPDGDILEVVSVQNAVNGTVSKNGNNITFVPTNNFHGNASFTYTITDGDLTDSATVNITVTQVVQNQAPVANPDSFMINQNTTLTTSSAVLLANDMDPNGDPLTLTQVFGAVNGVVSKNGNTITFVPTNNFHGTASFGYTISDGSLTASTTVTITVNQVVTNQAPIAVNDSYTTAQNTTLTRNSAQGVLANDSDPNLDMISVVSNTNPANGTLNMNSNGSFTFTPSNNFTGTTSFTYTISDGALTASATVTISVTLGAPSSPSNLSATGIMNGSGNEDAILFSWSANASNQNVTNYQVRINGGSAINKNLNTNHTFSNLTPGQTYTLEVRAVNATGNSAYASISKPLYMAPPVGGQTLDFSDNYAKGSPVNIGSKGPQSSLGCPNQNTTNHIYVDNSLSSNGTGTYSSPFNSLATLTASNVSAGRTVCLKRGNTYTGSWNIPFSGSSSNPIKITSYGPSNSPAPIFNRSTVVKNWSVHSGNIYYATLPNGSEVDKLIFNNELQTQARHPNINSNMVYREPNSASQFKVNNLNNVLGSYSNINLVGAQAVTKTSNWAWIIANITARNGDFLNYVIPNDPNDHYYSDYANSVASTSGYAWGIYFRNKLEFLDSAGEWHFDPSTSRLYFWAPGNVNPNAHSVEIMGRDKFLENLTSIVIGDKSHLILENLDFRSAPRASILGYKWDGNSVNITVKNCRFKNTQRAIYYFQSTQLKMIDNIMEDIFFTAIRTVDVLGGDEYRGNVIRRIGLNMPNKQMNYSSLTGLGIQTGISSSVSGTSGALVKDNIISETAYIGIKFDGSGIIENNVIHKPLSTFSDGGAIYFERVAYNAKLIIRNNHIIEINGNLQGTLPSASTTGPYRDEFARGIYFGREGISDVDILNNTLYKVKGVAIMMDHTIMVLPNGSLGVGRNYLVQGNTIFGSGQFVSQTDWSTDTLTGSIGGNPNLYNTSTGWTNCSSSTRHLAGNCFGGNFNDRVLENVFYRTVSDQIFRKIVYAYGNGTNSFTQTYPNRSKVTGYVTRSNMFGNVGGVQGSSNHNIYINPFNSAGTWGNVTCMVSEANNGCGGSNVITLQHWRTGYEMQDQQSHEFEGLRSSSTISASERGKIYFNNTNTSKTYPTHPTCDFKMEIQANGTPNMIQTGSSITVQPWKSVIVERNC